MAPKAVSRSTGVDKSSSSTRSKKGSVSSGRRLYEDLQAHSDYFDDLVNRFPASIYISRDSEENYEIYNKKFKKGQNKNSKEAKRGKLKLKQQKYDPAIHTSTVEQMRERDGPSTSSISLPALSVTPESSDSSAAGGLSRIDMLREKLRAKIAQKAAAGGGNQRNATGAVSKRAARRAESQRRIEAAKQRNGNGGASHVERRKRTRMEIDENGDDDNTPDNSTNDIPEVSGESIDYGTLVGLESEEAINKDYLSTNKSLRNMTKKKSLERLMEDAEKKKRKLDELKDKARQGDEEAADKASKIDWSDAMKSASGDKVHLRNDPALLKKAIKRKEKKKQKSAARWNARLETKAEKMAERNDIRNHNISQRKLGGASGANLSNKRLQDKEGQEIVKDSKNSEKKKKPRLGPHSGKNRPGFEGKKTGFLNKD